MQEHRICCNRSKLATHPNLALCEYLAPHGMQGHAQAGTACTESGHDKEVWLLFPCRLQLRICRDCRQNVMQAYKVALATERRQQRSGQLALPAPSLDSSSGCACLCPLDDTLLTKPVDSRLRSKWFTLITCS